MLILFAVFGGVYFLFHLKNFPGLINDSKGLPLQDGVLTFKPLSARDKDKLAAAFNAAIGDLIHDSLSKKLAIMRNCFEGRSQPALAELLDTIIWLAEKRALGLDISE